MDYSNVDMGGCSTNQHQAAAATPRLCGGGCGFFGTAEKQGLCSKCYNARLKQAIARMQAAMPIITPPPSDDHLIPKQTETAPEKRISSSRCSVCSRKLGVVWHACKCGVPFCSSHRHPEAHGCTFDYKQAAKIAIQEENPLCKADKMTRRI